MGDTRLKIADDEKRENVLTETTRTPGALGLFEGFLRRFRTIGFIAMLVPLIAVCVLSIALSLMPAIYVITSTYTKTQGWPEFLHFFAMACAIAVGYLLYGFSIIFVVPFFNFIMPFRVKPFRGIWFSLPAIAWYFHNALTYIVRYTFLELLTPTPMNLLFYRMMGMKVGKGVMINSTNISDPALVELGDHVTIGGSAHIFAHYGQKGYLIIAPVKIGPGTTIGLKASVMGGSTIGKNCNIKPHTVILPKTDIPDDTNI